MAELLAEVGPVLAAQAAELERALAGVAPAAAELEAAAAALERWKMLAVEVRQAHQLARAHGLEPDLPLVPALDADAAARAVVAARSISNVGNWGVPQPSPISTVEERDAALVQARRDLHRLVEAA